MRRLPPTVPIPARPSRADYVNSHAAYKQRAQQRISAAAAASSSGYARYLRTPTGRSVNLLNGDKFPLGDTYDPTIGPFRIELKLHMRDNKDHSQWEDRDHTEEWGDDSGRAFRNVSIADAYEDIEARIIVRYQNRAAIGGIRIISDVTGQSPLHGLDIKWAPVEHQTGPAPAYAWEIPDPTDQPLFAEAPAIDQGVPSALPRNATTASYTASSDRECFARGIVEAAQSRGRTNGGKVRMRPPSPKRQKRAPAQYLTDLRDVTKVLDGMFPDRVTTCEQGHHIKGATPNEMNEYFRQQQMHLIVLNRYYKILINGDHRTPAQLKHHSRSVTYIAFAMQGHAVVLDPAAAESTRIAKSVAGIVREYSGDERNPSVAVGKIAAHPPIEEEEEDKRKTINVYGLRQKLPHVNDMEPAIYMTDASKVKEAYSQIVQMGIIPPYQFNHMCGTQLREFSFFKDSSLPSNKANKVTVYSTGSHARHDLYVPLVREMFAELYKDERLVSTGLAMNHTLLSNGPGTLVLRMMGDILGRRQIPNAETKRIVLARQKNYCAGCHDAFTTTVWARQGEDPVEGECKPCWEHIDPVKAGGRDASPKNICALCIDCMLDKNADEHAKKAYRGAHRMYTSAPNASVMDVVLERFDNLCDTLAKNIVYTTQAPDGMVVVEIDTRKSRRFILCGEDGKPFPLYTIFAKWELFDGDTTKPGLYFVVATDNTLLHGCGLYGDDILTEAVADGLCELSDVKMMLRATKLLDPDVFHASIREIEELVVHGGEVLRQRGIAGDEVEAATKDLFKDFGGNILVGVLGRPHRSHFEYRTTFDPCEKESMERRQDEQHVATQEFWSDDLDRPGWNITTMNYRVGDGWTRNLHNLVVEKERLNTYRMEKRFKATGGTMMYVKTDAVGGYIPPDEWGEARPAWASETYKRVGAFFDTPRLEPEKILPLKYRITPITEEIKYKNFKQLCRPLPPRYKQPRLIPDWNDARNHAPSIPTSVGFVDKKGFRALGKTIVDAGADVRIAGEGGCGKTTLVIEGIVPELQKREIPFIIVTPTLSTREDLREARGCQGRVFCVQYLQKMFANEPERCFEFVCPDRSKPCRLINDEVSMMDRGVFEMLSAIKHYRPNMVYVNTGDFRQLGPIADSLLREQDGGAGTATYEDSPVLKDLSGGNLLVLTHSHRLKPGQGWHREASQEVYAGREIDLSPYSVKDEHAMTHIAYTNAKCKEVNAEQDEWYREQHPEFTPMFLPAALSRRRKKKEPAADAVSTRKKRRSQDLYLIPGTRLVGIDTGGGRKPEGPPDDHKIVNRKRYEVLSVSETVLKLKPMHTKKNETIVIDARAATGLLALGWALTFYCIQGKTFDEVYTVHEWHHPCSNNKARYVTMTRATLGAQVQIVDKPYDTLRPNACRHSSAMAVRKEFVDAEAWEELRERAHAELDDDSDGLALFARFEARVRSECFDDGEQRYFLLTRYGPTTGRRTARTEGAGIALQGLAKPLHMALLCARGHDLDIKKAHPTLLVQYLATFADPPEVPHIAAYVADAKAVHMRIAEELAAVGRPGVEEAAIKKSINRAMFLGKLESWLRKELSIFDDVAAASPTLARLVADFNSAANFVAAQNPQAVRNAEMRHVAQGRDEYANPIAGAVSEVINVIETKVVAVIEDSLVGESGMAVRAVVYDGLVAHPVDPDVNTIDASALRLAERRALEQTGYVVELVEKELYKAGSVAKAMAFLHAYTSTKA